MKNIRSDDIGRCISMDSTDGLKIGFKIYTSRLRSFSWDDTLRDNARTDRLYMLPPTIFCYFLSSRCDDSTFQKGDSTSRILTT